MYIYTHTYIPNKLALLPALVSLPRVFMYIYIYIYKYSYVYIYIYIHTCIRPTHSIIHVPLQVNRFQKIILLIVQYKYLKSCSRRFNSPESDRPHKIMR